MSFLFDPEKLKLDAQRAEKSTSQWISSFKRKDASRLDVVIHSLHTKAFDKVNCLLCANCCKNISPTLYDKDIERLARSMRIKPFEFIEKYLKIDEDNDYVFRKTTCPFLADDNYCSVYENRPKACREYPHTNRSRFYQILKLTQKNTFVCPAAFMVMEGLKKTWKK